MQSLLNKGLRVQGSGFWGFRSEVEVWLDLSSVARKGKFRVREASAPTLKLGVLGSSGASLFRSGTVGF